MLLHELHGQLQVLAGSCNGVAGHVSYGMCGLPRGAELCEDWETHILRAW